VNVVFCCLHAERCRISPEHAGCEPDDQPALRAGAALVSGHHTAKMLFLSSFVTCVQKGCGYHLDMLVVGLMTGLCFVMGLPCVWSSHSKYAFECRLLLLVYRKDADIT
jgi:hypothetical protein